MTSQRKQVVAALLIGVLAGLVAGVKLHEYRTRKIDTFKEQGPNTNRVITRLTEELGIDAKQAGEIKDISEKSKADVLALQAEVYDRFESIRLDMRSRIRKTLSTDQQKRFDELASRWDVKRKKAEPPPVRPTPRANGK
ncbi:MAG: hypothetical protein HY078_02350 [Elusimicrobia bacterium]|nr:hypothetical protein [Elusimicrobiota bacterium]